MFSNRILNIKPSETLKAKAKAAELRAKGIQVIDLTAGEPDFDTPSKIKEACKKALDENYTRYAPVPGLLELRQAISEKLKRDNALNFSPDQIVVTCGAKQAIFSSLQILVNPGDEVLLPAPYWVSFPSQVQIAEGVPVILPADETAGFKITVAQLKKALTSKTKLLILNSPSNPTGSCYSAEELKEIGRICLEKKIWVLSDEIYEQLIYDGFRHTSILNVCPELADQTLVINGASKTYAMTGWRMGFVAGPAAFIEKFKILQGQEITSIPPFIQRACITAFKECASEVAEMRAEFEKRRNIMWEILSKTEGIICLKPQGAFYLFPNVKSFGKPTEALAEILLEKAHVAVVAGDGFGAPGYLRLSFSADSETLQEAIRRIQAVLAKL